MIEISEREYKELQEEIVNLKEAITESTEIMIAISEIDYVGRTHGKMRDWIKKNNPVDLHRFLDY